MTFLKDEGGQGAAEYILLFGGIIVVAIAALIVYRTYIQGASSLNAAQDVDTVRTTAGNPP
nr:class III signal peptide-containing protein [uncultured Methanobacterium sp.]